jgi:hypothetical protein
MIMFEVWVDAKQADDTYWRQRLLVGSESEANEYYSKWIADPRYVDSRDACGGINPL